MRVRVYQPSKTAVQAGRRKTKYWVVEFEPQERREPDRLIGWVGSGDTAQQLNLHFPTKEAAIEYCTRNHLDYVVREPHQRVVKPKAYADNFIRKV